MNRKELVNLLYLKLERSGRDVHKKDVNYIITEAGYSVISVRRK